jgi:hypothetical protein
VSTVAAAAAAAAVLALTLAAAGCGSAERARPAQPEPQRLTAVERARARAGHDAIRSYCRRLGLYITGRGDSPGTRAELRAVDGARTIAQLARRKPVAPYDSVETIRDLAADTAEDLDGTNCSQRIVSELERGL